MKEQLNLFNAFEPPVLTVTQLNHYMRQLLESDELLQRVWIQGEISNVSTPRSGHIYFTLKDNEAAVKCVIWRSSAQRMTQHPTDGMLVEARGYISVYERGGDYQLYVDGLRIAGEGVLYQEFLELKAKLEAEGLFDEELKRPIPAFPQKIGIVTSATGAAVQDMLNTISQRFPLAEVILSPAAVQGAQAPTQIIKALSMLYEKEKPDVILIGRGGGSLEDLWCFNDEGVVRKIAASPVPIISGVGHETDFTLSDFAADLRAPTPTGAAVMATPQITDLEDQLTNIFLTLNTYIYTHLDRHQNRLNELRAQLKYTAPVHRVSAEMQHLDHITMRMHNTINQSLSVKQHHLAASHQQLNSLSPTQILKRGYAILQNQAGKPITSVTEIKEKQSLTAVLKDGTLGVDVTQITPNLEEKNEG
jgi:exodeoxyribonuclease VII large subunit